MNSLLKILLYLVVVVLAAALLSPLFYWLFQWTAEHGVLVKLSEFPFRRYFSRIIQVSAIVLVVPLFFWLGIRRLSELGLRKNPHGLRDASVGLLFALIPVVVLIFVYLEWGVYRWRPDAAYSGLIRIGISAIAVALVEEFLFRGVLLGLALRSMGKWASIFTVALFFAAIHFLRPATTNQEAIFWWSGFAEIGRFVQGWPEPLVLLWGFVCLLAAGLVLGYVTVRTQSLWLAIGIHAGWVLGQKSLVWFARYRPKPVDEMLPWVGPNVVSGAVPTGLVPLAAILLTGIAAFWYLRSRRPVPQGE